MYGHKEHIAGRVVGSLDVELRTARQACVEMVKRIKALGEGYTTSDVAGGKHSTPSYSYSFWIFRKFNEGERGSKTYSAKKICMVRVDRDGFVIVEADWEKGTTKDLLRNIGVS